MSKLLGLMFKEWREKHRFTLREIEEWTGISNAHLSQFEHGKVESISFDNAVQILICMMAAK
jgi:transcriptional regulator with XRE-family HTH domain